MAATPTFWVMETFEVSADPVLLAPRAAASQTGSHRQKGSSISALLSTLIPVFVVASVLFTLFLVLRKRLDRIYGPRTYIAALHKDERTPVRILMGRAVEGHSGSYCPTAMSETYADPSTHRIKKQGPGFFGWITEFRTLKDEYVLGHSSLDNYLFLRLFKIMAVFCFVGCLITWPILFPVNATGGGGQDGLDILSFSNVANSNRYYAHCFVAWIFLGFVMFVLSRETLFFAYLRQAYLLSPLISSQISSKTVLFVDVPEEFRDEQKLRHVFPMVRHIWLAHDPKELEDLVEDRDEAATKLESGEIKLIQKYIKRLQKSGRADEAESHHGNGASSLLLQPNPNERPTHRLKPLVGKKVDTIEWARSELSRLIPEVANMQKDQKSGNSEKQSAVFIEFETMRAAQAAFQQLSHQSPFHLTPKDIAMKPDMIIWKNIGLPWWRVKLLSGASTALIAFLCLFWTIPVAFIGVLTNVNYLTNELPWLGFINNIPPQILGIVTGLLPVLLLSILMKLVPVICTLLAKQFEPTLGAVQLKTQSWYGAFQVIQVFLVTTFSSGAASVATQIVQHPLQAPQLLAQNLPKASNFYISYFILKGLLVGAMQLLNVMPLLMIIVLGKVLDKTPRKMYNRYISLSGIGWGSYYPKYTNLGIIALAYSCIAPLLLGFATVGFYLLYLAFKYNVLFTLGTQVDTKGRAYARALQQLTIGIYLSEICLIGLFAIGSSGSLASIGPLILMIIFLIATIIWHWQMRGALHKLTVSLPSDLLAEEYHERQSDDDATEKGEQTNGSMGKVQSASSQSDQYQMPESANPPPRPSGFLGTIKAFLMPSRFASSAVLSKYILSPHLAEPVHPYTRQEREEAYLHPALVTETPCIWLPRDGFGLSEQEVEACRRDVGNGLEITDEAAWFDEKAKVQWDDRNVKGAPLWEDDPRY